MVNKRNSKVSSDLNDALYMFVRLALTSLYHYGLKGEGVQWECNHLDRKERRNSTAAAWSQAAWSFPGLVDRMLFAGSKASGLAPRGVQEVVPMPVRDAARSLDEDGVADLHGQAAVIGVHEAWF